MTTLYAQPYDLSASGFYFDDAEGYDRKSQALRNAYSQPVEEFEIQFIDGERIDAVLASAWGLNQANIARFFEVVEAWSVEQKQRFIIAVGEYGCSVDLASIEPDDFEIDVYEVDSLRDLAEMLAEDGLYGEIPEQLTFYIDYEAIARDLTVDFGEIEIAGTCLVYALASELTPGIAT